MKKFIYILFTFLLLNILFSCSSGKKKKIFDIEHFNISLVSDLSNRINNNKYPKSVDDTVLVNAIVDEIYPNILKTRVEVDQIDKINVRFTSRKIISYYNVNSANMSFDFNSFDNSQQKRISYILDRDGKNKFNQDKKNFKSEFAKLIMNAREKSCGADIWSFFNNVVDKNFIINVNNKSEKMVKHSYKNIIVLFTDGYIEAGLYGDKNGYENKKYYLSSKSIHNFRKAFKKSGDSDIRAFFKEKKYGLIPLNNPLLENAEIMAVELYDRSLTASGNATVHPTDGEILDLFWSEWMKESKVKRFKVYKMVSSKEEFIKNFREFAHVKICK